MYPTDLRYTEDHEWVRSDGECVQIGITDFAQDELGEICFVELPEAGSKVKVGDALGTVESTKAVSEIFAPVSGTVESVNDALDEAPETINKDPHGEGWYCTIKLADTGELEKLMDGPAYEKLIGK